MMTYFRNNEYSNVFHGSRWYIQDEGEVCKKLRDFSQKLYFSKYFKFIVFDTTLKRVNFFSNLHLKSHKSISLLLFSLNRIPIKG